MYCIQINFIIVRHFNWLMQISLDFYFLLCVLYPSVAPYNVTIMGDDSYGIGFQLELTCSSEGTPDLEYSWSRTRTFSATTSTNTSTLTIGDLATVDGGDYTCTVTNDAGTSSRTITINGGCFALHAIKVNNVFQVICPSVMV